jgi:hypothetical protein
MKKFFTLFTMALMAMGVNAQNAAEVFVFADGTAYEAGKTYTTENTELTIGTGASLKNSGKPSVKSHKAYILGTGLSQKVSIQNAETGEMEEKDRYLLLEANTNPTAYDAAADKDVAYKPENKLVPEKGAYYIIKTKKAGKILAGVVVNADKPFYVVKASDKECLPTTALTCTTDGDEGTVLTLDDSFKASEKLTGTVEFDVAADESYYVFCTGSKIGFFGYIFTPGTESGINTINAEVAADAPAYNLAGQKVGKNFKGIMIQNGKKVIK